MYMKIFKHIALIATTAALVLAGCTKDNDPNTANRGKEKPKVEVELADHIDTEFNLRITPSSNSKYVGYVVYTGTDNAAPSAYDIVTDNLTGYLDFKLFENDGNPKDALVKCILNDDYQVFAASITESGLLSEVTELKVNIKGAHPEIELLEGTYTITPSKAIEGEYEPIDVAVEPFNVTITKLDATRYIVSGPWFNFANIALVATFSYDNNTLSMDGSLYSQGEVTDSRFGYFLGFANEAKTLAWVLFGAGQKGTAPMIFTCDVKDKKAIPSSVKQGIDIEIYTYPGQEFYCTVGAFLGGEKITYANTDTK